MTNEKVPRTRKLVNRIAELNSLGLGPNQISDQINNEFGLKTDTGMINRMIKRGAMITGSFLYSDEKTKEAYKEILSEMMSKVKSNIRLIDGLINDLNTRKEELKKDMPESSLIAVSNQLNTLSRTINDSVRTMNEVAKLIISTQSTEIKVSLSQQVSQTLQILKELENQGYISINEEYYKSDLYKESQKRPEIPNEEDEIIDLNDEELEG